MIKVDSPEIRAAILTYRQAPREIQKGIQREAKAWAPELRAAIIARAPDRVSRDIAQTARVTATATGLRAVVGAGMADLARPWEFGTGRPDERTKYAGRSPKGRAVIYDRRTQRQVPRINPKGRFVYPAVADTTPRLVGRWVRAIALAVTNG